MSHLSIEEGLGAMNRGLLGLRCLLVDDDPEYREALAGDLLSLGCRVESVGDGFGAIRLLRDAAGEDDPIQVVLVDSLLAGVKPKILAAMIRQDPRLEGARVVLIRPPEDTRSREELAGYGLPLALSRDVGKRPLERCLRALTEGGATLAAFHARTSCSPSRVPAPKPATASPGPKTPPSPPTPIPARPRRVLVADDMAANRKLVELLLRRSGWQVEGASDGAEALERLSGGDFDLVLMDCHMPGMDGYAATREIRNRKLEGPRGRLPVIALTAGSGDADRALCQEAGMDDFLPKPFETEDLERILEHWGSPAA